MASDDISGGMPVHFCLAYGPIWTFVTTCCVASALIGGEAVAAKQGVETGISVQETFSDNPLLQAEPIAKSDFVTEIAPYVRISEDSERLNFSFDYSPHLLLLSLIHI